jgi:hypothetical protein
LVLLRVLREICGAKWDEVTDEWRKLHNKEHHDLYCSQNIIWVIKQRIMRWAGNVACMGRRIVSYRGLVGIRGLLKKIGIDGRIN